MAGCIGMSGAIRIYEDAPFAPTCTIFPKSKGPARRRPVEVVIENKVVRVTRVCGVISPQLGVVEQISVRFSSSARERQDWHRQKVVRSPAVRVCVLQAAPSCFAKTERGRRDFRPKARAMLPSLPSVYPGPVIGGTGPLETAGLSAAYPPAAKKAAESTLAQMSIALVKLDELRLVDIDAPPIHLTILAR